MSICQISVNFVLMNTDKIKGFLPEKSEKLSTGYDVRNAGPDIILRPFQKAPIPLGFKAFIPKGWWFNLVPRSSTFTKKHLHCLYGTIDESYEGQWIFAAQFIPPVIIDEKINILDTPEGTKNTYFSLLKKICEKEILHIKHGDKIAQIIISPRYEFVPVLTTDEEYKDLVSKRGSERGSGGFGSTGN